MPLRYDLEGPYADLFSGIFRTSEAEKAGLHRSALSRMVDAGTLLRLAQGIYLHRDAEAPNDVEFIVAQLQIGPEAAIGGLTALFHYGLAEQVPQQTWVVVPTSYRGHYPAYRLIRTKQSPRVEIVDHDNWRIVTLERSIVEAFRYSTKLGFQTALTAARTALREGKTTEEQLYASAKRLELWPFLAKHWEAVTTP